MSRGCGDWYLPRHALKDFYALLADAHPDNDAGELARDDLWRKYEFHYAPGARLPTLKPAWEPEPESPYYRPPDTPL
jgi:hypothetical protein